MKVEYTSLLDIHNIKANGNYLYTQTWRQANQFPYIWTEQLLLACNGELDEWRKKNPPCIILEIIKNKISVCKKANDGYIVCGFIFLLNHPVQETWSSYVCGVHIYTAGNGSTYIHVFHACYSRIRVLLHALEQDYCIWLLLL